MASSPLNALVGRLRRLMGPAADQPTDRELLVRFGQGDESAFANLVDRHGAMVLNLCRRRLGDPHSADDAFQATFILLAQKAKSVPWQESIAGWLHQTAYRVCCKARVGASRRRFHESQAGAMKTTPTATAIDADFRDLLDEELERLPDKYRLPLVLCYLEGKSNEDAAAELRWTRGTLSGRLARGRDLLGQRLTRRGLGLASAALTHALTQTHAQAAALSPALAQRAIEVSIVSSAGSLAGSIAEPVAALVTEVSRDMFISKLKLVAVVVCGVMLIGAGSAWLAIHSLAVAAPADVVPPAAEKKDAPKITVRKLKEPTVPGRGLPEGNGGIKEFADAKALTVLGEKQAQDLAVQVDFAKEKIVQVSYQTGGPPFGVAAFEIKNDKGNVIFFVDEPKVNVRGRALKFGNEFFAVTKDAPTTFRSGQ